MLPKRQKTSHEHPKEVTLSDFSTIFMPFMLTSWVKFLFFVELWKRQFCDDSTTLWEVFAFPNTSFFLEFINKCPSFVRPFTQEPFWDVHDAHLETKARFWSHFGSSHTRKMHTGAPKSAKGSKKGTRTRGDSYAVSMFLLFLRFQTEKAVSGSPKAWKYTEIGLAFPLKSCFRKAFVPVAAYRKSTNSGFASNDEKASHNHP
jgi:hypothetical protein